MRFINREDAGRQLAEKLAPYAGQNPLVLGLPRGGVPVAFEVAAALDGQLDIWSVRKVGAPRFPELGLGAVAEGGAVFIDHQLVEEVGATEAEVERLLAARAAEVVERAARFREGRPPPRVEGRTVIIVDDGIATGGTAHAAIDAVREAGARHIVLAAPVAASDSLERLRSCVDDVVCVLVTDHLRAIGEWYVDFTQVADQEVSHLLRVSRNGRHGAEELAAPEVDPIEVTIAAGERRLEGTLALPEHPRGLVLFAHGSGSSRFSPRNRQVAAVLQAHGMATLLFDLLTREEEREDAVTAGLRFDIGLLAERLVQATHWVQGNRALSGLPLGYFGASTGAAAALVAAAQLPGVVSAVVSRGGRPDLAGRSLGSVQAPTLLIVGGADREVLMVNRRAAAQLNLAEHELAIVPGATHLFEEEGALDAVAHLAAQWFERTLTAASAGPSPSGSLH